MEWFYELVKVTGLPLALLITALVLGGKKVWLFGIVHDLIVAGMERIIQDKNRQIEQLLAGNAAEAEANAELTRLVRELHAQMVEDRKQTRKQNQAQTRATAQKE